MYKYFVIGKELIDVTNEVDVNYAISQFGKEIIHINYNIVDRMLLSKEQIKMAIIKNKKDNIGVG